MNPYHLATEAVRLEGDWRRGTLKRDIKEAVNESVTLHLPSVRMDWESGRPEKGKTQSVQINSTGCPPKHPRAPKHRLNAEIKDEAVKIIRTDTYKLPRGLEALCL